MDYTTKLNELATAKVLKGEYPESISSNEAQIKDKRQTISDYRSGKIARPQPKSAYVSEIEALKSDISALETQNSAARKTVDDKYLADIEAQKADPDTMWEAIRCIRDDLLTASDWTQIPDCPQCQSEAWVAYRKALRDIPQDYDDPDSVFWPVEPGV